MSSNTFTEALELAYAEAWRLGDELDRIENGEIKFGGGEEGQKRAYNDHWREVIGAHKVLAVLLNAAGLVGRRTYPARPDESLPCTQQTWIRLMQWGVRQGLTTQDKIDEVVTSYPQYTAAMENLGKDVELHDFRDLSAERRAEAASKV